MVVEAGWPWGVLGVCVSGTWNGRAEGVDGELSEGHWPCVE